jgi:ADP-heptose:LPS heptosyltransferase
MLPRAVMSPQTTEGGGARPRLVVLRALGLGDLLVAVPALHALRRAFPHHHLLYASPEWLSDAVELVGGYGLLPVRGLDEPLPLPRGSVDIAVNLHGKGPQSTALLQEVRPRLVVAHHGRGVDGPGWVEDLNERARWTRLLQWHGIAADPHDVSLDVPPIAARVAGATVIHVGAAFASRLWPADRFAMVARRLSDNGHRVVFTGSSQERRRALEICDQAGLAGSAVLAGSLQLREFAACVAAARLVISADTGAAHLASAYGRPSIVLFGPVGPGRWGPPPGPHVVLTRDDLRRGDPFADSPDPALLGVTVEDVLLAAAGLPPEP